MINQFTVGGPLNPNRESGFYWVKPYSGDGDDAWRIREWRNDIKAWCIPLDIWMYDKNLDDKIKQRFDVIDERRIIRQP